MADSRIYNFTDTQETYVPELWIQTDGSSLLKARKIAIGTIAPKINTLAAAAGVNVAQHLVRVNNGAGVEEKMTIRAFFDLFVQTVASTLLYDENGTLTMTMQVYRFDKLVTIIYKHHKTGINYDINIMYVSDQGSAGAKYILPEGLRPASVSAIHDIPGIIIQPSGEVWARLEWGGTTYTFTFSYLVA